ncbi:MAG: hypothetical protein RLZZ516_1118 [Cyanobacteriota bacterium]
MNKAIQIGGSLMPIAVILTRLPMATWLGLTSGSAVALSVLITGGAVYAETAQTGSSVVRIEGSSTVHPFTQAAIRLYRSRAGTAISFRSEPTGTTAGLRVFCRGGINIAAASRPMNASELKACADKGIRFLELPVAFDAISVVVPASNTWARQISTGELRRLWSREAQGRVLRWRQVNARWPDEPISLCGPGQDSGTYDSFNKAINGREENARQDYTASEDDEVLVRCVANNPLALGYFGYDYFQTNRNSLRALAINGPRGLVLPSEQSVQQSRYQPLSRPLFYYVNDQQLRSNSALRQFLNTTLQNGGRIARQARLIPLQDSTYRLVTSKMYKRVLGSAFAGQLPLGLSMGQVLERSFDALKKPEYR